MNPVQIDPATGMPVVSNVISQPPVITGVPQHAVAIREHFQFVIPPSVLPTSWSRPDADRTFSLSLLSTAEEELAMRAATQNGNFDGSQLNKHWMLSTVYMIGGQYTGRNFDRITEWLDAIGPKARKLVDKAFGHLHNISDAEGEAFLAGMQRKG